MVRPLLLSTIALLLSLGSANPLAAREHDILRFEERFLNSLTWQHPNATVKLVGYKKIIMTPGQLRDLEKNIAENPREWDDFHNAYFDPHERTMRVYFPVEGALVYHDDEMIEMSHLGEHSHHESLKGDCAVVGRYKTEQVHGVDNNRVEGGIIWLTEPAHPVRKYGDTGNIMMYDFGWRHGSHDHHHGELKGRKRAEESEHSGGSCKQNHGNRVCSQVYGINNGRCTRDYRDCIDYNGWPIKDCSNHGNKFAFPGSDCFVAVAQGHCWNEAERAL